MEGMDVEQMQGNRLTSAALLTGGTAGFVCDLMRANYEAVGFLPRPRVEDYVARQQVLVSSEGGELCGYVILGGGWPILKVYQTCVHFDARRLDHASALISRLEEEAFRRGCTSISLWCASDLEANAFWRAAGFFDVARRSGGVRRARDHIRWVRWLPNAKQTDMFVGAGALAGLTP